MEKLIEFAEKFSNDIDSFNEGSIEIDGQKPVRIHIFEKNINLEKLPFIHSPAYTSRKTGEIFLSKSGLKNIKGGSPDLIFHIILWCYYREQTNSDIEADWKAFEKSVSCNKSGKKICLGMCSVLESSDAPENITRINHLITDGELKGLLKRK
jgi:hypothetical protein